MWLYLTSDVSSCLMLITVCSLIIICFCITAVGFHLFDWRCPVVGFNCFLDLLPWMKMFLWLGSVYMLQRCLSLVRVHVGWCFVRVGMEVFGLNWLFELSPAGTILLIALVVGYNISKVSWRQIITKYLQIYTCCIGCEKVWYVKWVLLVQLTCCPSSWT